MKKINQIFLSVLVLAGAALQAVESPTNREWHEYCEMTIHTNVDGWYLAQTKEKVEIPIDNEVAECQVRVHIDFLGRKHTSANLQLSTTALSGITHELKLSEATGNIAVYPGVVPRDEACAPFDAIIEKANRSGGTLVAAIDREYVRQDWKSTKNTDVYLIENFTIGLDGKLTLRSGNSISVRGKYCSQKPE